MKCQGMTLIEVVMVLAIVAVLASLAVPGLYAMVQAQRRQVVANELVAALKMARTEAILRHQAVTVRGLRGNGWSHGWKVMVDHGGKGYNDFRDPVLSHHSLDGRVTVIGNRKVISQVRFDTLGAVTGPSGFKNNGTLFICPGQRRPAELVIVLAVSGRVRLNKPRSLVHDPCLAQFNQSP